MNPEPSLATPAPAGSKLAVKLADLLVAVGALVILLFSGARVVTSPGNSEAPGLSLWSWLAPLGIFVILAALALVATAAVDTWWKRDQQYAGLHRHHVQVGLALYVLVTVFGMMLAGGAHYSVGWGGIVDFFGALLAAGGALLNHFNLLQNKVSPPARTPKSGAHGPAATYQTGYAAPPQGGYNPSDAGVTDPTAQLPPQQ